MKRTAEEILEDLEFLNDGDYKDIYVKLLEDITDSVNGDTDELEKLRNQVEELQKSADEYREKYIKRFKEGKRKKDVDGEDEEPEPEKEIEEDEKTETFSEEDLKEVWKDGK